MTSPVLRRLQPPDGATLSPDEARSGLGLGALAPEERPYLVLNMVSSADGKVALEGRSGGLGNEADRQLFHHLRTQVDAVMIGAGTLRAERYGRIVRDRALRAKREREGLAADPLAIVVSAGLSVSGDLPLFQEPEQRVVVLTRSEAELEGVRAEVEYMRGDSLHEQLGELRRREVRSVLCEGGPGLNAELVRGGLADELFLSLSPSIVGGEDALTAVAGDSLEEPRRMALVDCLENDGFLFLRYRFEPA